VNPLPTPTINASGPTTFCAGGSVTLTSSAASTYLWSTGATTQAITVSTSGAYSVTVTDANGCNGTSATTNVTVNPLPTPTINASGPTTFCAGGSVTLTATAASSYLWSTGATTQVITVSTTGAYSVTVTDANGCNGTSAATNVTATALPQATAANGGPFCSGSTITLIAAPVAGASYSWTGPNGFASTEPNATFANATAAQAGVYTLTVTVGSCTSAPANTTVVVRPALSAPVASNSGPYCAGQRVALSVAHIAGAQYQWVGPNGFVSNEQNPVIDNATTAAAGVYSVFAVVNGCVSPTGNTTVVVAAGSCAPRPPVDIVINKSVDVAMPNEGDLVTFTITAHNLGAGTATALSISDPIPAGVTFSSATPSSGSYDAISGLWTIPTLAEGSTATLKVAVVVSVGQATKTIENCATLVSATPPDVHTANNQACASITVQPPDLEIVKTVDIAVPHVGDVVTYTITATNHGPGTAAFANVLVSDVLPNTVDLVSSTASLGTWNSTTGQWSIGTLVSGATATLQISAKVNQNASTVKVRNCAALVFTEPADLNSANNVSCAPVDLSVTKTVDKPVVAEGDTIRYTVTVRNNGPSYAAQVRVTSLQIDGLTFISASTLHGSYSGGGTGLWDVGPLAVGESVTLYITARTNAGSAGSTLSNCAGLTLSRPIDEDPLNNQGCASVVVTGSAVQPAPDLAIVKGVDQPSAQEGAQVTYSIIVTNRGSGAASSVSVDDHLPAGLVFASATATMGSYSAASGVWSVGSLADGASATLTIGATVTNGTAGMTITNCAAVTTLNTNAANDQACASLRVDSAESSCDNRPPLVSVPVLQNVQLGSTLRFRVAAVDPDGDTTYIKAVGLPTNARFDEITGNFTFSPSDTWDAEDEVYTPTFVAYDGRGGVTSVPVAITVVRADGRRQHVAGPRGDTTRQPLIATPQGIVDASSSDVTFKVTATSQQTDCATDLALLTGDVGTFNAATGDFRYTLGNAASRRLRIAEFRATDCARRTTTVTVPIQTGAAASHNALVALRSVTFDATRVGGDARSTIVTLMNSGTTPLRIGSVQFDNGASFRVEGLDVAPALLLPARTLELRVSFAPTVGGHFADRLKVTSNEGVLTIDVAGDALAQIAPPTMAPMPSPVAPASYVSGDTLTSVGPKRDVSAPAHANSTPVLSVPGILVAEIGKRLRFRVAADDADGDAILLAVSQLPAGATFDPRTGDFTFLPTGSCGDEVDRVYDVTFVATDTQGASISAPVQITTIEAGDAAVRAPIVSVPSAPLRAARGEALRFRIAAQDADDCTVVTSTDAPGRFDATTGEYIVTPAALSPSGAMLVTFTAKNCSGVTSSRSVRIDVVDPPSAIGRIDVPVRDVEFASTPTRSTTGYVVVPVTNRGAMPLRISAVRLANGTEFRIDGTLGVPVELRAGETLPVRIEYLPKSATAATDTLVIESSDAVVPSTTVTLHGSATN
jgi:uncharacterized repeat protein (TIGR01451 family)